SDPAARPSLQLVADHSKGGSPQPYPPRHVTSRPLRTPAMRRCRDRTSNRKNGVPPTTTRRSPARPPVGPNGPLAYKPRCPLRHPIRNWRKPSEFRHPFTTLPGIPNNSVARIAAYRPASALTQLMRCITLVLERTSLRSGACRGSTLVRQK